MAVVVKERNSPEVLKMILIVSPTSARRIGPKIPTYEVISRVGGVVGVTSAFH